MKAMHKPSNIFSGRFYAVLALVLLPVLPIVITLVAERFLGAPAQHTAATVAVDPLESTKTMAKLVCRQSVKHGLKDPDGADFQSVFFDTVEGEGSNVFCVRTEAKAMNSFGAKLRARFECRVQCWNDQNCSVTSVHEF